MATNGRDVLRFRTRAGVDVALSLPAQDAATLVAAIAEAQRHAATRPDIE